MSAEAILVAHFERFKNEFWTEQNKEAFDCVLFLTSQTPTVPYSFDDCFSPWFFQTQNVMTNMAIIVEHEEIAVYCSREDGNTLREAHGRVKELRVSEAGEDVIQTILPLLEGKRVAGSSELCARSELSSLNLTQVHKDLEAVLVRHESGELTRHRNAAKIADKMLQNVLWKQLHEALGDGEERSCKELAEFVEPDMNKHDRIQLSIKPDDVVPAFRVAVSCGKNVNVDYPPKSRGRVTRDVCTATVGVRYRQYVGVVGRTLLVNATPFKKRTYKTLVKARAAAIQAIKPNGSTSAVYDAFEEALGDELSVFACKILGRFVGVNWDSTEHVIAKNSPGVIPDGSIIVLTAWLKDVQGTTEGEEPFTIQITDTIQVSSLDSQGEVRECTRAQYKYEEVAYTIENELNDFMNDTTQMAERTRGQQNKKKGGDAEDNTMKADFSMFKRSAHRPQEKETTEDAGPVTAYDSEKSVPKLPQASQIVVQAPDNCVFFPIFGVMVPFHISAIKSATEDKQSDSSNLSHLRVTFDIPKEAKRDPTKLYIKELRFTNDGTEKFKKIAKEIGQLRSHYQAAQRRKKEEKEIYTNEKLEVLTENRPKIGGNTVQVRPPLSGKKNSGNLEAHINGFRYRSMQGDNLHVMYKNIRLAVFQRSTTEIRTILHFLLKSPMLVAGKPTTQVTFFKQIVGASMNLGVGTSGMTDTGEFAEDERERRIRKKVNKEFSHFCKAVEELSEVYRDRDIPKTFETPKKKLGFYGVPGKEKVFLAPTYSALVSVSDQVPFVLMNEDIEIAVFERVASGGTFDLTFVLLGWHVPNEGSRSAPYAQINMIDMQDKKQIEGWLDAIEVPRYEMRKSMDWKETFNALRKDYKTLFEEGDGWKGFFAPEEEEDDHEEDFQPDDSDYDADDDDDEDFEEIPDEDEDDDGQYEDESDEGISWEQQEEEAKASDRKRVEKWKRYEREEERSSSRKKSSSGHHHHHHDKKKR